MPHYELSGRPACDCSIQCVDHLVDRVVALGKEAIGAFWDKVIARNNGVFRVRESYPCADECARHRMDHCQACAEACRRCAQECRAMAA